MSGLTKEEIARLKKMRADAKNSAIEVRRRFVIADNFRSLLVTHADSLLAAAERVESLEAEVARLKAEMAALNCEKCGALKIAVDTSLCGCTIGTITTGCVRDFIPGLSDATPSSPAEERE